MATDFSTYSKMIENAAAGVRDIGDTSTDALKKAAMTLQTSSSQNTNTTSSKNLHKTATGTNTPAEQQQSSNIYSTTADAAIKNYENQILSTQKQANRSADALEMTGKATEDYISNLDTINQNFQTQAASAQESFSAASEKADEYVQAAKGRVNEVLTKLDDINKQIAKDRDFAKAHDMQAAVQTSLASMKAEERNILETYGTDSKEFMQFQQSKRSTLATIQSNIQANYANLAEEQGKTYLGIVEDAYTKSNMYLGYQEQQHVEMLKYQADQEAAYSMQVAQFQTSIEQLKMGGMENLANWLVETPSFAMDSISLVTLLADLAQTQETNRLAESEINKSNPTTTTRTVNAYPGFKSL